MDSQNFGVALEEWSRLMKEIIKPGDMIARYGIDGLLEAAENYYGSMTDHSALLKKPFHDTLEGPYLLCKTGMLLAGLRLGKGMRVLDFGAGSCWLSRFLNELNCITVSVEPSRTALEIGRELFARMPPLTPPLESPQFLEFDGRRIPVADNSVDRVISMDTFHHVPNPMELLREFFRVLVPGGIIGFAEVGAEHSRSAQSQREMRDFQVLENDLHIENLWKEAQKIGFTDIYFKNFSHPDKNIAYADYARMAWKRKIPAEVRRHISESSRQYPVFFLVKGTYLPDSRGTQGLSHRISLKPDRLQVGVEKPFTVSVQLKNSGSARWLHRGPKEIGAVFVGAHLYGEDGSLVTADFARVRLDKPFLPGETGQVDFPLRLSRRGRFKLVFDLVSEQVCWFETLGAQPAVLDVKVE